MPSCYVLCPIVTAELKKIEAIAAAQAPWILKEQLSSRAQVRATADWELDRDDQKQRTADQAFERRLDSNQESVNGSKNAVSGKVSKLSGTEKDQLSIYSTENAGSFRQFSDINGKRKVESATQSRKDAKEGTDGMSETDIIKQTTKFTEDPVYDEARRDKSDKTEITDGRFDVIQFRNECEPTCSRRISRKKRIFKLEERQNIIDAYLLNKGTRYFDDVCTCSLSCIIFALKQDSFIRSTVASVALFTIGLKLCMEFNAWYMPIRLS